jgi:hypothetical protein
MKTIKLIKRNGEVILKTTGDSLKVLELCTCCLHDFISYQGNVIEIQVSA